MRTAFTSAGLMSSGLSRNGCPARCFRGTGSLSPCERNNEHGWKERSESVRDHVLRADRACREDQELRERQERPEQGTRRTDGDDTGSEVI